MGSGLPATDMTNLVQDTEARPAHSLPGNLTGLAHERAGAAPGWEGWPRDVVAMFVAAGVDVYYANKARERTGCSDPQRIIRASRLGLPALWA